MKKLFILLIASILLVILASCTETPNPFIDDPTDDYPVIDDSSDTQALSEIEMDWLGDIKNDCCPDCGSHCEGRFCTECGFDRLFGRLYSDADIEQMAQNPDAAEIQEKIKTAGDAIAFHDARIKRTETENAFTPHYNGWSAPRTGEEEILSGTFCCCGGRANLFSYLLLNDYEMFGQVQWWGAGNHCINWLFCGGKFYVIDLGISIMRQRFVELDSLSEFYDSDYLVEYFQICRLDATKTDVYLTYAYRTDNNDGHMYPTTRDDYRYILDDNAAQNSQVELIHSDDGWTFSYEKLEEEIPYYNYEVVNKGLSLRIGNNGNKILTPNWGTMFSKSQTHTVTVLFNDKPISDYTFEADENITAEKQPDGRLSISGTVEENKPIVITYHGNTGRFFFSFY